VTIPHDNPGDPIAALGDSIALGYGDGIAEAVRELFKDPEARAAGRVAFCAPGSEMLAAVACNLDGQQVSEVRSLPGLSGDDCFIADFDALGPA
jgi:hypothetical protein